MSYCVNGCGYCIADIVSSMNSKIFKGPNDRCVIYLLVGVIFSMWWSQKVVPGSTFGGKFCITK